MHKSDKHVMHLSSSMLSLLQHMFVTLSFPKMDIYHLFSAVADVSVLLTLATALFVLNNSSLQRNRSV